MLSLPLFVLYFGASMATLIQVRQADDLSARVKALEDYLAEPDSSCVKECGDTWNSCADKCPIDFTSDYSDFAFDVRYCCGVIRRIKYLLA